jgi:hypothetical protein
MIVTENITINGKKLIRTYSDSGYLIRKAGTDEIYSEAYDPAEAGRTYIETDEPDLSGGYFTEDNNALLSRPSNACEEPM